MRIFVLLLVSLLAAPAAAKSTPSTHLLFSYVTNTGGFDTGILIANTSMDPLGTTPESGSCTITFFGTNPGSAYSTGTIAAGSTFGTLVSVVSPGFEGYAIADCSFDHAHGLTFVSDLGARNFASGEEALILPAKKKRPLTGERLGH
jgi:hypothetical protein